MQVLVICNYQCNTIFWFQETSVWSPRSWVETFMQLKIIFSSWEEKQTLDSVSLIGFDVILVFANALLWNVALVVRVLNVFSANRVSDPSLSFFFCWSIWTVSFSPSWPCLSLQSFSLHACSFQPNFERCRAPHRHSERDLWVLGTQLCEFVCGRRQRAIALRPPPFCLPMVLPSCELRFVQFNSLLSFWSFSQLLTVFMVSTILYFLGFFWFPPSIPCNRMALFLHLNRFVGAQPLGYSVLRSPSAWGGTAQSNEWLFSLHLVKSLALFFVTTCRRL